MNKEMYIAHLHGLEDAVRQKGPKKWEPPFGFLLHDNAQAHWSLFVKDFLARNNVTIVEHPHILLTWLQLIFSCSPD